MADPRSPLVEMLWERHDPLVALWERFGFQDGASAGSWVVSIVLEHWGVQVGSCERIVISDRNALAWLVTPGGQLLAKWSAAPERFPRLSQVARLTVWLDEQGLPVSTPLAPVSDAPQVEVDGVSMCLQRMVPGDLLDTGRPDQVRAAGAVLARLHLALAGYPDAARLRTTVGPPVRLADRMATWLESDVEHLPAAALDTLRELVADAPHDHLPTQLVHGDFRASNVLCSSSEVAAVIDLEEMRVDHCVVEVARSAVMLGTRFRDWGPVSVDVRATFLSGYESVRSLTPVEAGWWDALVLWHALLMVPPGDDPTGWGPSALDCVAASRRRH